MFVYKYVLADDTALIFTWHGGEYIDVQAPPIPHASEVINVWDSYEGQPRIDRTQEAFEARCQEWIQEYDEAALIHDVNENWS